jgi:PAS domain S-box-containing protein
MEVDKPATKDKDHLALNIPLAVAKFRIIYNSQNQPVDALLLEVNDEFENQSGKSRKELIGRSIFHSFPELSDEISKRLKKTSQKISDGKNFQYELYYEPTKRWYDVHVKVMDREKLTLVFYDCTNRKTVENQINKLNNIFFELGVDAGENINVIVKKTHEIISCACSIYNRLDEKESSLITWSEYNAPADLDKIDKPDGHICYEATIRGVDQPVIIEDINTTEFCRTDSNVIKYGLRSYLGMPVIIDGKTIGSLCVVDVTPRTFLSSEISIIRTLAKVLSLEQKRYFVEENLKKALEAAKQANEDKTRFLANMSHEIRTPLNGIIGFSEMLSSQETDENKARILRMIEESGNQLVQIVNDLFDYSRIETGKIKLQPEEFLLSDAITSTLNYFNDIAAKKNIHLDYSGNGISDNKVFGDPIKLKQILINLIGNAIKFTDQGTIHVSVKSILSNGKVIAELIIEDTGMGIGRDQLQGIFDEFKQHDRYLAKKIKGTGLGLAITKKLTDLMNGKISVESELGKGTRFTISIPFDIRIKNNEKIGIEMNTQEENKEPVMGKVNILLAEDNEANQFLIKAITKSQDWDIVTVDNGEAAVEMYKSGNFDLVLMDVQMPVMNGYDATKIIREYENTSGRRIPIIALTAYAMKSDKDLCLEAGMDDYISKPFKRAQFLETVQRVINQFCNKAT